MEVERRDLLKPLAEVSLNTDFSRVSCISRLFFWWVFPQMKAFLSAPLSPEALMALPEGFLDPAAKFAYSGRLAGSLKKAFLGDVLWLGAQGVVISAMNFLLPLYIIYVQYFIENDRPTWEGLCSLAVVASSMLGKSLLNSRQSLGLLRLRMVVKTLLQELIYNSSLRLREGISVGQSVNILQVDASKVYESVPWAVNILYYPFHFASAVALLCWLLGLAAVAGVGFFILLFVLNFYIERSIHRINVRIMEVKDERMKHTTELLTHIRPLKMLGWEDAILERVFASRKSESAVIKRYMRLRAASISSMLSAPALVALVMLTTYVYVFGHELTVTAAFGTLSTLFLLQIPLREFPSSVSNLNQAVAAAKRIDVSGIQAFLNREQVEGRAIGSSTNPIVMRDACFAFSNTTPAMLHDLTIQVAPGEFLAVVGPVGSGKTAFLKSILGELRQTSGICEVNGSVAFCGSIDSWILNATIRDNIVVGRQVNEERYQRVLEACALLPDLQSLPAGDSTEIGERGINLSGGQKARVALARAVYADADVYLLDDPLGAVDAHVRTHIMQRCFLSMLRSKTRVLVTHSVEYLSQTDRVVTLEGGRIAHIGGASDSTLSESIAETEKTVEKAAGGRLVRDEERSHGEVKWEVYTQYFRYAGGRLCVFLMLLNVLMWILSRVGADMSLKYWGETMSREYMLSFVLLSVSAVTLIFMRTLLISVTGIRAGNAVHNTALTAVTRAPINLYFDVTPLGRLLNRFSKDVYDMDIDLPFNFGSVVATYASFMGMLLVSVIYVPWIIFLLPVLYWLAEKCQKYYLAGANNTNRMLRNANSPLVQHFTETLAGLKIIRSLDLQKTSIQTNANYVGLSNKILFNHAATVIWLDIALNSITVLYFLVVTGFLILEHERLSAGAIGLIIAYMLPLPRSINMNTQFTSRLKTNMVSMERVHQLSSVSSEAPLYQDLDKSLTLWPPLGSIEFRDVSLRYRANTPIVLKGVSFRVEGGEKVGVVGRTGSGKSSLLQALFRVVELHRGQILIDEVDIATIGLRTLRQALTLIPQDPLLFKGTMRENVDPLRRFETQRISAVLADVNLQHFTCESPVGESGNNLSSGERQLVCIARASLGSTRLLLMDEATSSVDLQTDETIHTLLRTRFTHCTILTIAHRLATIMQSSRVLVLDQGQVKEFAPPQELMHDGESHFSKLLAELPK